jgi:hypothetical protein
MFLNNQLKNPAHKIFFDLITLITYYEPPLWSSGQSSWLQIQIFWEVVGLERGPLSLVKIIEELLERKVTAPV